MKGLAITHKGIEDIAALEVNELINSKAEIKERCVVFELNKLEDLCTLCYKAQSVSRVIFLFDFFSFDNFFDAANDKIKKIDFSQWTDKKISFRVKCEKIDNEDILTNEIEQKIGEFVIDNVKRDKKYEQKVDLEDPDLVFFVFIAGKECYIGIDFSGFDLSKRGYKIFTHPASLKGTVAYALVRIADYKKNDVMLDPFTGSGIIPIESALFASDFPVNFYNKDKFAFLKLKCFGKFDFKKFFQNIDKKIKMEKLKITGYDNSMKYVNYAKKNAKIAGVDKKITFSKVDAEWIDIKFKEGSVDKIATNPPIMSKYSAKNEVEKTYKELFYHADYVLNKNGVIVLISKNTDLLKKNAENYNFRVAKERKIYTGKEELFVIVFKK